MSDGTPPVSSFEAIVLRNDKMYFSSYWFLFLQKLFDKIYNPSYNINTFFSSPVNVTKDYVMIFVDTTSGVITANLPTAVNLQGRYKTFKNIGTNNLIIDAYLTETIDGSSTLVLAINEYATLISDGAIWRRVS